MLVAGGGQGGDGGPIKPNTRSGSRTGGPGRGEGAAGAQGQDEEVDGDDGDEGLLEAAAEHARSQLFVSMLKQLVVLEPGQTLAVTPPTTEEYAASFQFGVGMASGGA